MRKIPKTINQGIPCTSRVYEVAPPVIILECYYYTSVLYSNIAEVTRSRETVTAETALHVGKKMFSHDG
jgi:hypothetical protein